MEFRMRRCAMDGRVRPAAASIGITATGVQRRMVAERLGAFGIPPVEERRRMPGRRATDA
jgi:hypothetical protein